jgi:flagellar biosynthesis/type III secretory pathway M-ring protein FliF/YscJ
MELIWNWLLENAQVAAMILGGAVLLVMILLVIGHRIHERKRRLKKEREAEAERRAAEVANEAQYVTYDSSPVTRFDPPGIDD